MTTTQDNQLCICIPHPEPQVARDEIIKAIAAAIRWRASYHEVYTGDDFNLMILSVLLAQLTNDA